MKVFKILLICAALPLCLTQRVSAQDRLLIKRNSSGRVNLIEEPPTKRTHLEPTTRAEQILSKHTELLGLKDPSKELKLEKQSQDKLGIIHLAYQQLYKDIPVFAAKTRVHLRKDGSDLIQAEIIPNLSLNIEPKIDASKAEENALASVKQLNPHIDTLKISANAKLTILSASLVRHSGKEKDVLTYLVGVSAKFSGINLQVFVDAGSGEVIHSINLAHDAVSRQIYDCSPGDNPSCYLNKVDPRYPNYILGRSEGQPTRGLNPRYGLADTDSIYDLIGSAHNYFEQVHSRNGANMRGGMGDGINYPSSASVGYSFIDPLAYGLCPNALWDGEGALAACAGLTTSDILGHEYTHAVTDYSAGLIYQYESGALNESISDIFGEAIERRRKGSNDWLLGAGSALGVLRNMKDPASIVDPFTEPKRAYPDRFYSSNYLCDSADHGQVHHNSSVPNHAAYLMAMGGSFNGCSIQGLGQDKEEAIIYRALTEYISPASGFNDAYEAILLACSDLYSAADCNEVTKALRAVEMDQAGKCSGAPPQMPNCSTLLPTQKAATASSIALSKKLIKKGAKRTRYGLIGQVLNANGEGIQGKDIELSCFFNGSPLNLSLSSFESGEFTAAVTVRKGFVVLCTAASDNVSSAQVKLRFKPKS